MAESSNAAVIQTLNQCIARFYNADENDMAELGTILVNLDEIQDNQSLPQHFLDKCKTFNKRLGDAMLDGTTASVIEEGPAILTDLVAQLVDTEQAEIQDQLSDKQMQFAQENISIETDKIDEIEEAVLQYEQTQECEQWEIIRGSLHSLKGDMGVLGLNSCVKLIHRVESIVVNHPEDDRLSLTPLFFAFKDFIMHKISEITEGIFIPVSEAEIIQLTSLVLSPVVKENKTDLKQITQTLEVAGEEALLAEFITEGKEHIIAAESALIELEHTPNNPELINAAFRSCHTIKGVAGFLNLKPLQELAHTLENIMDKVRNDVIAINQEISNTLLDGFDQLNELLIAIEDILPAGTFEVSEKTSSVYTACEALNNSISSEKQPDSSKEHDVNIDTPPSPQEKLEKPAPTVTEQVEKPKTVTPATTITASPGPSMPQSTPQTPQPTQQKKSTTKLEETVRVSVQRLDRLIDSIGEIVIAQSILTSDPDFVKMKSRSVEQKATQISMVMRQIQEEAMSLRMVSLKSTFQKMSRLIHDLSQKINKKVSLQISGEDTELDKSIIEHIGDPLVHMLRNSVDHGLETSEERIAAGKDPIGTIQLKAYHKSGNVVIDITDDGAGINTKKVLEIAIQNGVASENQDYSDQEIFQFIFAPGFSTADEITDISGRGVGMDVVKRNIMSLRGKLDISSERGKGTTFSIKLPLTMAIIDGMVVSAGRETFILPTLSIISTVNPSLDQIQTVRGKGKMLRLHEELYRFVKLSDLLEIPCEESDVSKGIAILVENISGERVAIWVDTIIKKQQVVIKSMGPMFENFKWISGGAVLGDGKVNLILDVNELFQIMEH